MDKKRLKVAFIATVYRHLEAFHLPFIQMLQQKGYEVHVYGARDFGKEGLLENNVICHDTSFKRNPFHYSNIKALSEMVKSFKAENFVMVHFHTPVASIIGRIAAKIAEIPYVIYTAHGFHFYKGAPVMNWLIYYPVEWLMAFWTDALITINSEDYHRAKFFKVRDSVYFVSGVGVVADEFAFHNVSEIIEKKRSELALKQCDFVIVNIAELNDNKNQVQLIEAVKSLKNDEMQVKCLLVGVGESEQSLKNLVNQYELNGCIQFLGFRRDIPELLAASNTVALLSKREGLPKALLEALAASKPIVATNIRGSRDVVTEGENGFIVPVSDVDATIAAFTHLIKNPSKVKTMGEKSQQLAAEYDLNHILINMDQIYQRGLQQ